MPSESQIEQNKGHRKLAKAAGWVYDKIMRTSRNSFPDRFYANGTREHRCVYCQRGRVVLIEFKAPGEQPRPQQVLRHMELRAAGVEVHVVDNVADANRILGLDDTKRSPARPGAVRT